VTIVVDQTKEAIFTINRPLVTGYISALGELNEFGIEGDPSLEMIAKLPGAISATQ
jgi:hypothetical protein